MRPGLHVLVADDDPLMRAILETYFTDECNARVTTAENGLVAMKILGAPNHSVDMVLSDLNMPHMDGVQFLRHLKDLEFSGKLGIISGEDDGILKVARDLADFYGLDLIGVLPKPVNKQKLDEFLAADASAVPTKSDGPRFKFTPQKFQDAVAQKHIQPYYQPKIDIRTGRVSGAEALARWVDPEHGLISPGEFIDAAQAAGQMKRLTISVLRQAIDHCSNWRARGFDLDVAINLTPETFEWLEFPDELAAIVDAAYIERTAVVLEVTESNFLKQDTTILEVLARLRIHGFHLAIDDFGTGFSNIEQLRKFPFSQLKIDQSFVRNAALDRFARATVEASVHLGRELNMSIVAEGVENREDWDFVVECGVDQVQGYFISKPMPEAEFFDWVQKAALARAAATRPTTQPAASVAVEQSNIQPIAAATAAG